MTLAINVGSWLHVSYEDITLIVYSISDVPAVIHQFYHAHIRVVVCRELCTSIYIGVSEQGKQCSYCVNTIVT